MTSRIRSSVVAACAVLFATAVSAQTTIQLGGKSTLTIKGFISASFFAQDNQFTFGNGQNAEWPTPPQGVVDRWFEGGDVRNTRLTLVFDGPKVAGDWKAGGTLELDFFGGFNGTGGFANSQPVPRLRLAFAEISNGSTTIRIGQDWSPLFGNVASPGPSKAGAGPVSLSHIAFPLGYGSGDIGWRFPGIFIFQTLTPKDAPVNADLELAVMQGSWNTPGSTNDNTTAGNASSPQYELRGNVGGKLGKGTWSAYVVGHYDNKDLSGANASAKNDKLTGSAYELGTKIQQGPVMFQGSFYSGHSIAQNFGALAQFQNGVAAGLPGRDRIFSEGGWAQVGYDFTPNWSLFGFWGMDDPKDNDIKALAAAARDKNTMYAGMVRWRTGPYALGFEYLQSVLTTGVAPKVRTRGQQIALSTLFNF